MSASEDEISDHPTPPLKKHHNGLGVKKRSYALKDKLDILRLVRQEKAGGNKRAMSTVANAQHIPIESISKWNKDSHMATLSVETGRQAVEFRKRHPGRKLIHPVVDADIVETVKERRALRLRVTGDIVAIIAKRKHRGLLAGIGLKDVRKMIYRTFERNEITKRRVTNNEIILDELRLGEVVLDFVQSFNLTVTAFNCPASLFINMDETPVYFDPEKVSVKKTTTTSKCSALLAVSLDGKTLIPYIVFKAITLNGKVMKETSSYDRRSIYNAGPKRFSDTRIMIDWVDKCLKPHILKNGGSVGSNVVSILMMDNYGLHLTTKTRTAIARAGFVLIPLPANSTSALKILDVGKNKPFKHYYEHMQEKWKLESEVEFSRVSGKQCAEWLNEAWVMVRSSTIINTARKIGFIQ